MNKKCLYEYYVGMFKIYVDFVMVFDKLIENYEVMVIKMINIDVECV